MHSSPWLTAFESTLGGREDATASRIGKAILPLPCRTHDVKAVTHVRSTWLKFSLDQVRGRGLYEAYLGVASAAFRPALATIVAGHWLDVSIAHAHYSAMSDLRLSDEVAFSMGAGMVDALGTTLLSRTRVGVASPWDLLITLGTVWERSCKGGAVAAYEWGAEAARIDFVHAPHMGAPYCRTSMRGLLHGLLLQTATGVTVQEVPRRAPILTFAVSWSP